MKDDSVLYHFTSEFHLFSGISPSGYLDLTAINFSFKEIKCPVVWLTASPSPENMGFLFDGGKAECAQLPLKETTLERLFVSTLNTLISDKARAKNIALEAVTEAVKEVGDGDGDTETLARIERAQAAMLELNKQRAHREVDAETYGGVSRRKRKRLSRNNIIYG
jgi:hypothetical protein